MDHTINVLDPFFLTAGCIVYYPLLFYWNFRVKENACENPEDFAGVADGRVYPECSRRDQVTTRSKNPSVQEPLLADGRKATVLMPLTVVPIQVEEPPAGVPAGIEDVPATARVHPDRAETDKRELPLQDRVCLGETKEFRREHRTDVEFVHLGDDLRSLRTVVEVHESDPLHKHACRDRVEVLARYFLDQVVVVVRDPVKPRLCDLRLMSEIVVHRHNVGVALHGADGDEPFGQLVDVRIAIGRR